MRSENTHSLEIDSFDDRMLVKTIQLEWLDQQSDYSEEELIDRIGDEVEQFERTYNVVAEATVRLDPMKQKEVVVRVIRSQGIDERDVDHGLSGIIHKALEDEN